MADETPQTANASRSDLAHQAHVHYAQVSAEAHQWSSTIPDAINAWAREPETKAERDWLREQCLRLERALATAMIPLEVIYATEMDGVALCQDLLSDVTIAVETGREAIKKRGEYVRVYD